MPSNQPKDIGTLPEITAFCTENGLPKTDAEYLFWKWEGNGWTNGGKPIKSWRATVKSWQAAGYLPSQKNQKPKRKISDEFNMLR